MAENTRRTQLLICSFCGKNSNQVDCIVTGQDVNICNECVDMAGKIIQEDQKKRALPLLSRIPTPQEIKDELDQFVIDQDDAKESLAVAVYNHYKRVEHEDPFEEVELEKSNILLIGPTGTGKTLLAQTLARFLQVPFTIADATTLTEAGYVGEDVENIIVRLLQASDYDVERAERGIVFIDEIDKIARKDGNPSITRDVSGEGVQQALLKMLEGTSAAIPPKGGRKHPEQNLVNINTKNILFICGGAFVGLDEVIAKRTDKKHFGFAHKHDLELSKSKKGATGKNKKNTQKKIIENAEKLMAEVQPEDLMRYGLIPELIGRMPVVTSLSELSESALRNILLKPKNALTKQYKKMLEMDGIELVFEDDAIDAVVKKAVEFKTGARALRAVMERIMLKIMYKAPSLSGAKKCIVNKDVILHGLEPKFINVASEETKEESMRKSA